jgi:cellulose synthase/poly-beta-1,6-N-acetylglucosamine synthase-like glycosyltransferase
MHPSPSTSTSATPARRAAAFAWRLKNALRAQGRARLGMACQLTGSGMAFPPQLLDPALVEQGGLVEDLELGLQLAARGQAPVFCPHALVHSLFPDQPGATRSQRTRWEHGHLDLLLHQAPYHLRHSARQRDWRYASLALDLCIPPLSLLLMLNFLADSALLLLWRGSAASPFWLLALTPSLALLLTLAAAWWNCGRDLLSAPQLFWHLPRYVLAKVPLYWRFLLHRQRDWIASVRERR